MWQIMWVVFRSWGQLYTNFQQGHTGHCLPTRVFQLRSCQFFQQQEWLWNWTHLYPRTLMKIHRTGVLMSQGLQPLDNWLLTYTMVSWSLAKCISHFVCCLLCHKGELKQSDLEHSYSCVSVELYPAKAPAPLLLKDTKFRWSYNQKGKKLSWFTFTFYPSSLLSMSVYS